MPAGESTGGSRADALGWVLDASHLARADDLAKLARGAAARLGATDGRLYIVDYEQQVLVPFDGSEEPVPIDGTQAGDAFASLDVIHAERAGEHVLFVPLLDGTERIGVLELRFPAITDEAVAGSRQLGSLFAELVATRSVYGDLCERLRRRQSMTLAAEIQWGLLPPLTHTNRWGSISCILGPCYDIGGDAFDYAVNGTTMHWAIFDAMGHGLDASLLATVTIGAYRNARRRAVGLEQTYVEISDTILATFGDDRLVTGILAELDLESGLLRRINAGHPAMVRVRAQGQPETLPVPHRSLPFGIGTKPVVLELQLQPGDRLIAYTDGVTEMRNAEGEFFGAEGLVRFLQEQAAQGHAAPEALRRLHQALFEHRDGRFHDDATTLLVEWLGPERERIVFEGAVAP